MLFIPVMQSWIFGITTPVFRVTRSFRNHSNMLICSSKIIIIINVEKYLLNIFVEAAVIIFSQVFLMRSSNEQHLFQKVSFATL